VENPDPPGDPNRPADLDLRDLPGPPVKIVMLYPMTRDRQWTNGVEQIVLLATALQPFVNATRTMHKYQYKRLLLKRIKYLKNVYSVYMNYTAKFNLGLGQVKTQLKSYA
jgi:hypothetical protein